MGLFFRKEKKIRTILSLDRGGVRLIQLCSNHDRVQVLNFAQKTWSSESSYTAHAKKEIPFMDLENVKNTFKSLLDPNGMKGREIDILLPDCIARTSILELDSLPRKRDELLKLAYFKGQKSLPYSFEDTRIGIQVLSGHESEGKVRVLAVFISRALIEGLENILCDLGREPRRIGLASLNLYNLFEKGLNREGDTAFVTVFEEFFSIFLFANGSPAFFRSKSLDAGDNRLFFELQTSFLYYQKQNAAYRPQRALLWGIGDMSRVAAWLEELFGMKPDILEGHVPLTIKQNLAIPTEELVHLTPALGMVTK